MGPELARPVGRSLQAIPGHRRRVSLLTPSTGNRLHRCQGQVGKDYGGA